MDILQAKETVVKAGLRLLETGLIARTWGNVSCRVSDTQFVITPSGKAYDALTTEDIVLVNISDLSFEGDVKPSSEKGIHAEVYKIKPEMNFVIHTHQLNASVASVLNLDINNLSEKSEKIIGDHVPCATYGLPSTGKLREGVVNALSRSDSKAVLMSKHGALCMGADYDEAFAVALELEKVCDAYIKNRFLSLTGSIAESFESINEYVVEKISKARTQTELFDACNSEREGTTIKITPVNGADIVRVDIKTGEPVNKAGEYPKSAELHRAVYAKRKDVNYIVHSKKPEIVAVSRIGKTVKPMLDDFAQLVGVTVRNAEYNPNNTQKTAKKVVKKLRGRNGVFLKNNGAFCVAGTMSDAEAIEMVTEKNCKTFLGANLFDAVHPISPIETRLMRLIYKLKYSKQAK